MNIINKSLFGYNLRHYIKHIKDTTGAHPGAIHGKRITRAFRPANHKGGTRKAKYTNHDRVALGRAARIADVSERVAYIERAFAKRG